jgi:hypothetical protein
LEAKVASLRLVAIPLASIVILSGCAAQPSIYEFSQPSNICEGAEIYLEISDDRPQFNSTTQDRFTLSVVDASGLPISASDLEKIEVDYRVGFFEDSGFEAISTDSFSVRSPYNADYDEDPGAAPNPNPSPLPSQDSFLDVFWDTAGPSPSPDSSADGTFFGAVLLDASVKTGVFYEFFEESEIGGQFEPIAVLPGAFLAKCLETGDYVAAGRLFPNTSVSFMAPQVTTDGDQVILDFSQVFSDYYGGILAAISPIQNEIFSADDLTNRWLNSFSFSLDEVVDGGLTRGISLLRIAPSDLTSSVIDPLESGTYWATISYALESEGQDVANSWKVGTSYYNLVVVGDSYTFIPQYFEPVRSVRQTPAVDFPVGGFSVSSKGRKQILISGTNLTKVQEVAVGGKLARILSASNSDLKVSLPTLPAGSHKVSLNYQGGQIREVGSITYTAAKKLGRFQLPQAASRSELTKLAKTKLKSTPSAIQVDCVVNLPSGVRAKALRNKAAGVCAALATANPSLKTVVRTVIGESNSQKSFSLLSWG